jgi:hypothetical protein
LIILKVGFRNCLSIMKQMIGFFCLFLFLNGRSQQKVQVNLTLLNSTNRDPSRWIFRIKLVNKGFEKYWVQDTTYIANSVRTPSQNLAYPMTWRKINGKYMLYDTPRNGGGPLRDKCMDSCCNCINILRHDSISFDLKLLAPYKFDKGQYKAQAYISIPLLSCDGCEQLPELESNYVFFTVR